MNELASINMAEFISQNYQGFDNKIAIVDDHKSITYKELDRKSKQFAYYLTKQGVVPGDHIIILMEDCIEWVIAWLGANRIGCTTVHVSNRAWPENLPEVIRISKAKIAICNLSNEQYTSIFLNSNLVLIGKDTIMQEQEGSIDTYYANHPDEICYWVLTSGTGGGQKIIAHRHGSLPNTLKKIIPSYDIDDTSIFHSIPKLGFQFGFTDMIMSLVSKATSYISCQLPTPTHVKNIVRTHNVTHLFSVPAALSALVKTTTNPTDDFNSVKVLMCGGEVLPLLIQEKFKELFGIDILDGHGMSESQFMTICQTPTVKKIGTIGKPLPGVEVEIRREDGSLCAVDEIGELYIKDICTASYYVNSYALTKDTFLGRWLKTNDLVSIDSDGYIKFSSRKGDIVKINGEKVSMIEIENILLSHELIEDCVIIKSKDDMGLTKLKARIILKTSASMTSGDVRRYLRDKLEQYKIPKFIEFTDTIAKTPTAKKIRVELIK